MKIAKKNILSSLKAMKGRLFGTRQKPQSESEKNLQSIAREEKSQYSKQQPEIKAKSPGESVPTDAMILRAIGTCEFQFGKELHRVSEAKLEFIYDTGLDLFKIYVIALSEVFGAIMFYIPEDMAGNDRPQGRDASESGISRLFVSPDRSGGTSQAYSRRKRRPQLRRRRGRRGIAGNVKTILRNRSIDNRSNKRHDVTCKSRGTRSG